MTTLIADVEVIGDGSESCVVQETCDKQGEEVEAESVSSESDQPKRPSWYDADRLWLRGGPSGDLPDVSLLVVEMGLSYTSLDFTTFANESDIKTVVGQLTRDQLGLPPNDYDLRVVYHDPGMFPSYTPEVLAPGDCANQFGFTAYFLTDNLTVATTIQTLFNDPNLAVPLTDGMTSLLPDPAPLTYCALEVTNTQLVHAPGKCDENPRLVLLAVNMHVYTHSQTIGKRRSDIKGAHKMLGCCNLTRSLPIEDSMTPPSSSPFFPSHRDNNNNLSN